MSNTPKKLSGFSESPQAAFEGAPYDGSLTDWVRELEQQAAKESRKADTREIRSKAGTHRVTVYGTCTVKLSVLCRGTERISLT